MERIKYEKNNNKCPYCNDKNYIVYGTYHDKNIKIFQCYCEETKQDFEVAKAE